MPAQRLSMDMVRRTDEAAAARRRAFVVYRSMAIGVAGMVLSIVLSLVSTSLLWWLGMVPFLYGWCNAFNGCLQYR